MFVKCSFDACSVNQSEWIVKQQNQIRRGIRDLTSVFPADAGVILYQLRFPDEDVCLSRKRGGDPTILLTLRAVLQSFPQTRGALY